MPHQTHPAHQLDGRSFDVVIVGGGIHGAFAAWDAALRGLRTALIERGDFGGATSSNSLKIVHGGLRYLQTVDLARMRESVLEQAALFRIAPHIVRPLPCAMPSAPFGLHNPAALIAGIRLYSVMAARVLQGAESRPPLPAGRLLTRRTLRELLEPMPFQPRHGGALWYDGIMESPERLLIGVLRAAEDAGATVANHLEATGVRSANGRVRSVEVRPADDETVTFDIGASTVLNLAGPWASELDTGSGESPLPRAMARACNVVVDRAPPRSAVALRHPRERRMLFAVPWRGRTMLGTSYAPAGARSVGRTVGARDVEALLEDANAAAPDLALEEKDVLHVHGGLLPAMDESGVLRDRPIILDHGANGGPIGLVSAVGVKWTTARRVAERAVDVCQRSLGREAVAGGTDRQPIRGGERETGRVDVYGTVRDEVDEIARSESELAVPLDATTDVTGAHVAHAVRREWARHLSDVVLRRTELGTAGCPTEGALSAAARVMANELGWSTSRVDHELTLTRDVYRWQS